MLREVAGNEKWALVTNLCGSRFHTAKKYRPAPKMFEIRTEKQPPGVLKFLKKSLKNDLVLLILFCTCVVPIPLSASSHKQFKNSMN